MPPMRCEPKNDERGRDETDRARGVCQILPSRRGGRLQDRGEAMRPSLTPVCLTPDLQHAPQDERRNAPRVSQSPRTSSNKAWGLTRHRIVFHGCQSRTQRPQFQPRRLLQCQPGPHPSAIQSTRRAKPILNKVGLADIGRACASTMAKVTEITIIGAITRITTTIPNGESSLTDEQLTQLEGPHQLGGVSPG